MVKLLGKHPGDLLHLSNLLYVCIKQSIYIIWFKYVISYINILICILVPVIKEKSCKLSSIDNFRPIARASILKQILLHRLKEYVISNDILYK